MRGAMGENTIDTVTDEAVEPNEGASASVTARQIRGSSLLLVGRFIALGLNFAVQLLIARYLTQSDYGAFAYALSLVTLFETIVTLGLDRGVGRFLAIYDEHADFARLLGTIVLIAGTVLSLGVALIVLVAGISGVTGGAFIGDAQTSALLAILIVLAPIQAADNLLSGVLAVFASARAIFFRKYVLGPGLRLVVVGLLIAGTQDVEFLAVGYVVSGVIGLLLYVGILWRILTDRGVIGSVPLGGIKVPAREIFAFTIPLLTTDLVYLALNTTDAIFLGHFWGTTAVAEYRVIQPLVGVNTVVYSAFTLLYMPAASRLFARGDRDGVADLYWKTAIWMAVFSFPVFALTTSLAGPVTVALYEERYADSAVYLALLSFAAYVNVALGFNGLTLRVYGFIRYTVGINLIAAALSVGLNLLLIPQFGALGAAVATTVSLIAFNLLKQAGLRRGTGISVFDRRYLWVYATIAVAAIVLAAVQLVVHPGFLLSLVLAGVASLFVLATTRRALDVADTFPEVLRLPFARRILGA
ncbi:MAG TPA: flippase [Candidatus Limnocylindrales bacterium]